MSIAVVGSPLEVLMLDVAEAFMAMNASHAYFGSQHHTPATLLFNLSAKNSSSTV